MLALVAKRVLNTMALCYATGYSRDESAALIDKCIKWGLVSTAMRLTEQGYRELEAARKLRRSVNVVPERGIEETILSR